MVNNPNDESTRIQETLISIGAKISEAIRDAVSEAADNIDATVAQRVGRSLTSTFASLAKFSEQAANNTFKISQGLLGSEGISKQLLSLEEKRLTLQRQRQLAELAGIAFSQRDYQAALDSIDAQKMLLEQEEAITKSIENRIGLTGKLAESISKIPGLGKLVDAKGLVEELRKAAVTLDKNGNLIETNIGKVGMMRKGFQILGKQIATSLLDPLTITTALTKQFLEINKASVDLQRLTGQLGTNFDIFANRAASAQKILETSAELTKQIGFNAQNAFSYETIANAADLQVEMGLAADEAGAFAMMAQTSGKDVDALVANVVSTTSAFNATNRSAVSQGIILRDVAKTSESIKLSLGNNDVALANAAAQARRLGMDLNGVNQIATSLLNFESSIESELEAQLLTGNQINLSKAREFALTNKLDLLGQEIFKNTVDIEKFGEMTRLGQEGQAKALGMTRDQLARVAYLRALETGMTEDQAAAAADVNAEEMKKITVQENFTAALNKVAAAFAPILEAVGSILSIPVFGPMLAGALIVIPVLSSIVSSIGGIITALTAKTIATAVDTTATVAQAGANTALATSNTAVATTGTAASGGFVAMGTALGAFGTAAAAAIPVLLSIAAVAAGIGLAFAGVGFALKQIPEILQMITPEKALGMIFLGQSLLGLSAGLAAVAVSGLLALPALYGLKDVGLIGGQAGGQTAATESPQGVPQTMAFEPVVNEIKLMREEMGSLLKQLVAKDTTINMDGYQVGRAVSLASVRQ